MDDIELNVELNIKSSNYVVNLNANENNLVLEIQNAESAESWKGSFDKKYIEDLTRKTGNFKSFPIFVNMLQSALNQESNTVTLDILTFNDLENLRNKSSLNNSNTSNLSRASNQTKNNKKYLIMTYNVEFDRINYPLQLRYQGILDSVHLLKIIKNLKDKIEQLQSNSDSHDTDLNYKNEMKRLEKENHYLKKENESLELEISRLNNANQTKFNGSHLSDTKTHKEINSLKKMIKIIEEDSVKEKNLFLKQIIKKNEEINQLKCQMNKMIENERSMVHKLKALKDIEQARGSKFTSRSNSKESIQRNQFTGHKSRIQSNSLDRFSKTSSRLQSNSLDRYSRASSRKQSISPASSTRSTSKRFNPTEYCRNKKSKLEEINTQKKREIKSKLNISSDDYSKTSNSSRQKRTSITNKSKLNDNQIDYETLNSSFNLNNNQIMNHRNNPKTSKTYNRDQEMKEIDEKLKSLHNLIKYSL